MRMLIGAVSLALLGGCVSSAMNEARHQTPVRVLASSKATPLVAQCIQFSWQDEAVFGVDASGWPMRLFTTNRWVTDEAWASAPDVLVLADRVVRSHRPADALGRWLFAQLDLFRPQIEVLLRRRDARLRALRRTPRA